MSEAKTYVFGNEGNGNLLSLLTPMMQQRGLDPNLLLAMNRNNNGFGGEGGWFIWIIFLFFLMGWNRNGNGWGNNGGSDYPIANILNNDTGRELLMSAIQGNATAISQLATTLNCDVNSIQTAIQGVNQQICTVGNQVGLTSQLVINAIQQGNMSVAQQLSTCCCDIKTLIASCCCDIKDSITRGNYENQLATVNQTNTLQNSLNFVNNSVERGFALTGYETAQLTCALQNTINQGILKVVDGLKAAELREISRELASKDAKIAEQAATINNAQQTAIFSQMIGQAVAPINASLVGLTKEVADIQCHLPATKTITDPTRYVPLNTEINVPFHLGYGYCGLNNFTNGFSNAF